MALDPADLEAIGKLIADVSRPKDLPLPQKFVTVNLPDKLPRDLVIDPQPENGYVSSEIAVAGIVGVIKIIGIFAAAFHAPPELIKSIDDATPYLVSLAGVYIAARTGLKMIQVRAAASVANKS